MAQPKKVTPEKENGRSLSVVKQDSAKNADNQAVEQMKKELDQAKKELEGYKKKKPATVSDMLVIGRHINALEDRLKQLDTAKISISAFAHAVDGLQESLTLKGAGGNTFQTNNHELISKIKDLILGYIEEKEEKTHQEILAFA